MTLIPDNLNTLLPSIQYLGVIRTNLRIIRRSNFEGMNMLRSLDLKENQISELNSDVFGHLVGLMKLDLSHNFIKSLNKNIFNPMRYLWKLIVNDNRIELFDATYFRGNVFLQEIHLWSNNISFVRMDLSLLKRLKIIDLRNNFCIDRILYTNSVYDNSSVFINHINQNCSQKPSEEIRKNK